MIRMRLARVEDLSRLLAIKTDAVAYMHAHGNDQWDADYPDEASFRQGIEKAYIHVLEIDDKVEGMIGIMDYSDEEYGQVTWSSEGKEISIHRVALSVDVLGKGYGRYLLNYGIKVAKERNIAIIKLDTYSKNKSAQKLFVAMGFHFVGDIHFPQRPLPYHCYEMVLNTSEAI